MVVLWGGPSVASPGQTLKSWYQPLRSMESAQTDIYRASKDAFLPSIVKCIRRWMVALWGGPPVAPVASPGQTLKSWYQPLRSMESAQTDRYRASKDALSPSIVKCIRRWMVVLWGGPPVAPVASPGQTLKSWYQPLRSMESAQTDRYRASKDVLLPSIVKSIRRWMVVLWGYGGYECHLVPQWRCKFHSIESSLRRITTVLSGKLLYT
jgi:hypothetical protein